MLTHDVRGRCLWQFMAVEIGPYHQYSVTIRFFVTAEGQSDKMASDEEVCMKQRGGKEFLHAKKRKKKKAPSDIHQSLLNASGDGTNSGCEHSGAVGGVLQQW